MDFIVTLLRTLENHVRVNPTKCVQMYLVVSRQLRINAFGSRHSPIKSETA